MRRSTSRRANVVFALGLTAVGLTAGYLFKRPCFPPNQRRSNYHYTHGCYTDLLPLYTRSSPPFVRAGDRPFSDGGAAYRDNNFEYPPATGLVVTAANSFVRRGDARGFVRANAVGIALFGLSGAAALGAATARRSRLAWYALAPSMVAYAFHNWDLVAVGCAAIGLWAFAKRRDGLAGVALGFGAAAKLFPGLALPALVLARRRAGAPAGRLVACAAAAFIVPNAIVLAWAGPDAWWFPWRFQSSRLPNFETVWFFIGRHLGGDFFAGSGYARASQAAATLIFAGGAILLLRGEWRRERFRPVTASCSLVVLFLLTTKVFSPQYAVWLLPFFALTTIPWRGIVAFTAADLFVLAAIFGFGAHFREADRGWWLNLVEAAVVLRYAALGWLLWLSGGAEDLPGGESRSGAPAPGR
ncbi:MAG: glycosyltransferase 87 family protein [Actinomycetota bacterium]